VEDRWAIAAYIRALQLSQNARLADVPKPERRTLDEAPAEGRPAPDRPREASPPAAPTPTSGGASR
jgi:hypothetical protein